MCTKLRATCSFCMRYSVQCCVDESCSGRTSNPRDPRSYAQQWPLRLAKPCQKRNPPRYFRVNDVLACASLLAVVPRGRIKAPRARLDIARGRFPKEFAINASSPHCASICFRLPTRRRRSRSVVVVVETNIRTLRIVCDFLRSCVFPRKWRRIDRAYPSRSV